MSWIPIIFLLIIGGTSIYRHRNNQIITNHRSSELFKQGQQVAKIILENTNETDIITLEPLGIIGFFSKNRKFADSPGLCSKKVTDLIKELGRKAEVVPIYPLVAEKIIKKINPKILVLRDIDIKSISNLLSRYKTLALVCPSSSKSGLNEDYHYYLPCLVVLKRF